MKKISIVLDNSSINPNSEELKSVRANVQFCGPDVHTIVVTSCIPNEGKSAVTMCLAASLALAGKKTLLVDADLRKSVMARKYAQEGGIVGLSEYLSGQAGLDDAKYNTQYENLDIIFSGQYPANPAELLSSTALRSFLEEQKKLYDYILIDTPPLGVVVDAAVVAKECDSAIMVIASGIIKREFAIEVKEQLQKSGAHIIGVVVNKLDKKGAMHGKYSSKYYNRYYGKYYGKYYGSKQTN